MFGGARTFWERGIQYSSSHTRTSLYYTAQYPPGSRQDWWETAPSSCIQYSGIAVDDGKSDKEAQLRLISNIYRITAILSFRECSTQDLPLHTLFSSITHRSKASVSALDATDNLWVSERSRLPPPLHKRAALWPAPMGIRAAKMSSLFLM